MQIRWWSALLFNFIFDDPITCASCCCQSHFEKTMSAGEPSLFLATLKDAWERKVKWYAGTSTPHHYNIMAHSVYMLMRVVTSRNKQNISIKKLGSYSCVVFPLSNKWVSAYRKPRMYLSSDIKYKVQSEYLAIDEWGSWVGYEE